VKEQIAKSPFVREEFLNLAQKINNADDQQFKNHLIVENALVNTGNRDFVDYRPDFIFTNEELRQHNINEIRLDSLHYSQINDGLKNLNYKQAIISKSDIVVTLPLCDSYEVYLSELSKKKRHELKRKKRNFEKEIKDFQLLESNEDEIFIEFINQHRNSSGEKGEFMTKEFEVYFKNLLQLEHWKIYFLQSKNEIISTAFCYENEHGCYLYNSSRNNKFNNLNPGIVLNDLIIQQLIDSGKVFFDFLKGTERYKYDLGGNSVQLYDLAIEL